MGSLKMFRKLHHNNLFKLQELIKYMNTDRIISIIGVIIGILGIISSIYYVGQYYNLKNSVAAINSPNAEVIGGDKIISGNVFEKPSRHLTQDIKTDLNNKLSSFKGKNITITAVMGDQEAFQYATDIKDYLDVQGWNTEGINQAVYSKPVIGQFLNQDTNGNINILIGGQA